MRQFFSFLLLYAVGAAFVTEIKVYENENIMLNCPIESLAVSWYKDNDEIIHFNPKNQLFVESDPDKFHYENGTLTLHTAHTGDSGLYKCTGYTADGFVNKSYRVDILAKLKLSLQIEPPILSSDDTYQLATCTLDKTPGVMNYTILDSALNPIESTHKLNTQDSTKQLKIFVKQATRAQFANLTCFAEDELTKTSESSLIRLATKPTISMELRSNKLICHTDGHPAPVVRYYDAFENEVKQNDGILIKTPGFYECEASNGIGIVAKGFKITRPNTLLRTFVNIPSTSKNLELTAEAVHDVPLSVTWSKNNSPFDSLHHSETHEVLRDRQVKTTSVLRIIKENISSTDSGFYMAQFTAPDLNQTRVSVRQEFEVEVEQPPRMDQIKFTTEPALDQLRVGDNVKISCHYEKQTHESHPLVKLLLSDMTRVEESNAIIKNITHNEQTQCTVSNSAGSSTLSLVVRPRFAPKIVSFERDASENLVCHVQGYPRPIVAIMLPNGTRINDNRLGHAEVDPNEFYMCTAKNELGESNMISNFNGINIFPIIGSLFVAIFLSATQSRLALERSVFTNHGLYLSTPDIFKKREIDETQSEPNSPGQGRPQKRTYV